MSTPTTGRTKLPFPKLGLQCSNSPLFWLSAWLRDQAAYEAINELATSREIDSTKKPALFHGLCQALTETRRQAGESLRFLVDTGGLLFAWHGTTALDAEVAA